MIQELQLRVLPEQAASEQSIKQYVAREKGLDARTIKAVRTLKRSIDARQRTIFVNLTVRIYINELPTDDEYEETYYPMVDEGPEVIVVGAGPGGLFAALRLIELGCRPIVVERGKDVHARKRDIARISREHAVDPESNYSFGEGGAGAYSDGKLYTRSKKRGNVEKILNFESREFVIYEILNSRFGFKGDTVDSLCRALSQDNSGKRFYSRSHVAYVDRGNIVIEPIEDEDCCEVVVREGQQRAYCGNSALYFELCDVDSLTTYNVADNVALLDADKIKYPLVLRRWTEGDSFTPFGMNGRKKISDYLIDHKVSMPEKKRQFVMLSEGEIAWLIGRRIGDDFRITSKTERVLRITKEII